MSRRQSGYLQSRSSWGPKTPRSLSLSHEVWGVMEQLSLGSGLSYSEIAERLFRRPDNARYLEQYEQALSAPAEVVA